jgi:hypothetical protein
VTRTWIVAGLLVLAVAAVGFWIASNSYWEEVETRGQLQGDALTNPFYGAQRLAELLGAHAQLRHDTLVMPPAGGVIVLGRWNWSLMGASRQRLEQWVSAGGRLVVSRTLLADDDFDAWTGVTQFRSRGKLITRNKGCKPGTPCFVLELTPAAGPGEVPANKPFAVCDLTEWSYLNTTRKVSWRLNDPNDHAQALRVPLGGGSVTVVNTAPFSYDSLLCKDNGRLFVAATQLRAGERIEFLTEGESEPLLLLVWDYGAPVVVLAMLAIALWLWRSSVRFGPLEAVPNRARRSLAEQIRGTGQFALRFGGGQALHAATVRALEETAIRHVPRYEHLGGNERGATLAPLTGISSEELLVALHYAGTHSLHELLEAIATLETARRRLASRQG